MASSATMMPPMLANAPTVPTSPSTIWIGRYSPVAARTSRSWNAGVS
jgi:hypothetical protein